MSIAQIHELSLFTVHRGSIIRGIGLVAVIGIGLVIGALSDLRLPPSLPDPSVCDRPPIESPHDEPSSRPGQPPRQLIVRTVMPMNLDFASGCADRGSKPNPR